MMPGCSPPQSPRTPDSAWSWLICCVGTLTFSIILGFTQSFAVVMPVLMKQFQDTRETTAWIGSIAQALVFCAVPLSSKLLTRINFRYGAILGTLMCASSLLLTSIVQSTFQLFLSYSLLYGLGSSLVFTSVIFAITKYFKARQGIALGIVIGGLNIGVISLSPFIQLLLEIYGLKTMYRISTALFGFVLFIVLVLDPNVQDDIVNQNEQNEHDGSLSKLFQLFKRPAYIIATVTIFLETFTAFVSFIHLVKYCMEVGISEQQGANLFIFIGICSLISGIVAGRIIDHKGVNPFHVNQVSSLSMALAMLSLQRATKYYHFVIYSVFLGLGIGGFRTTIIVLFLRTVEPRLRSMSFPVAQFFTASGNAVGPPFIGFIADSTGSYKSAFSTAGGIMLLAFFLPFLQYCFKPWATEEQQSQASHENNGNDYSMASAVAHIHKTSYLISSVSTRTEANLTPQAIVLDDCTDHDSSPQEVKEQGQLNTVITDTTIQDMAMEKIRVCFHDNKAFEAEQVTREEHCETKL